MGSIVVGYDDSDCGKAALDAAAELAKGLDDGIVVVFGYAPPGIWGGEIAGHEEAIEELGAKMMDEAKRRAAEHGIEAEVEMVAKRGTEALVQVADARDARMIVVGSYGEGHTQRGRAIEHAFDTLVDSVASTSASDLLW